MKYHLLIILMLVCCLIGFGQRHASSSKSGSTSSKGGTVHVKGYTKKDGTYVAPHERSAPDGNFDNNWSTKGNVNPYTGQEGTKVTEPPGYRSSASPSYGNTTNSTGTASADQPCAFLQSCLEQADRVKRLRAADNLKALGYQVNWQDHTYLEMTDWESRIRQAKRLKDVGYSVDWKSSSSVQMADWESRIIVAKKLKALGYKVDWQKNNYSTMADWQSRIEIAHRLKAKGINVDWHKYTFFQLFKMEHP